MDNLGNHRTDSVREAVFSMPLEDTDPVDAETFRSGTYSYYFERLRKEDPVYRSDGKDHGHTGRLPSTMTSCTYTNHAPFSSDPSITYKLSALKNPLSMFIATDPRRHEAQRKVVTPAFFAGSNLKIPEKMIRDRVRQIMDSLRRGDSFNRASAQRSNGASG